MSNKKLLIIDDEESFANTLKTSLEQHKYKVQLALNSEDALTKAESWKPSHCLLDLKLDQESGLKLIEPLKTSLPDLILVVVTGYASIATVVDAMKKGANNYLAKPIDLANVLNALENVDSESEISLDPMSPKRLEWEHIQNILAKNNGNVSATARELKMHRRTLQRKLNQKPIGL